MISQFARRPSRSWFAAGVARFLLLLCVVLGGALPAQTLVVDGPSGSPLPTLTLTFTLRARGLASIPGPYIYTLVITRNASGEGPFVETIATTSSDSVVTLSVTRLLPNASDSTPIVIYWKGRLTLGNGISIETNLSTPRIVPRWLTLIEPNAPNPVNLESTRRPQFIWQSAKVDVSFGTWVYDLEITNVDGLAEVSAAGLRDTVFIPPNALEANKRYRWRVRAMLMPTGDAVTVQNRSTFQIIDRSLPTANIMYQNFPNPFPSPSAFTTCFWFDVKVGGARVQLDIIDLRGSLVKRILPPTDLAAGIYGRGTEGSGSNCDNRFVWNGTAADGRSVPGGVYLARFIASGTPPIFKKVVFRGR
ncbi:MAG: hypothetical protein ACO1Q7_01440 [Gemmatimonas sp.]